MHYRTIEEVEALLHNFEEQKLAHEEWNHLAHLTVCTWYVMSDPDSALRHMREGIVKLNRSLGIMTTPASGYHETLTLFWLAKVQSLVDVCEGAFLEILNAVIGGLADKELVFFHYSRQRIESPEARMGWMSPDRVPLPTDDPMSWQIPHRAAG